MKRKGLKPSTVLKWPLATIAYVKWGEIAFHRKRLSYKNNVLPNSFWKESKNTRSLLFHNNPCQFFSLLQRPGLFVSNCFDPFKWIIGKNNNSFLSKYFLPRHLVFKKAFQMDHKKTFKMSIKINWVGELSWQSSSEIVLLLFVSFRERENEKKWAPHLSRTSVCWTMERRIKVSIVIWSHLDSIALFFTRFWV